MTYSTIPQKEIGLILVFPILNNSTFYIFANAYIVPDIPDKIFIIAFIVSNLKT
jgi:hypothetical protein